MIKRISIAILIAFSITLSGCCISHQWTEISCSAPKTCAKCGKTEGEPLPHDWKAATCTTPQTCKVCGATSGDTLPHNWKDATCTTPKTCMECNLLEGTVIEHTWTEAMCTTPETCVSCGETKGEPLGHAEGELKTDSPDYVAGTVTCRTYCQRCYEEISNRDEYIKILHNGEQFLMSPAEFASRLSIGFAILKGNEISVTTANRDGDFLIRIMKGDQEIGNCMLMQGEMERVSESNADTPLWFYGGAMIIYPNSELEDTIVRTFFATVLACDPSQDLEDANSMLQEALEPEGKSQRNGIYYGFAKYTDPTKNFGMVFMLESQMEKVS